MTFTRKAIRLRWGGGLTERAFHALMDGYQGGQAAKPASYARSLYDGGLLRVFSPSYNRLSGAILVQDAPTAIIDGVQEGSIAELAAAHVATDLECQSFEDEAYWDAEWVGDFAPILDYDPMRGYAAVPVALEER